MAAEDLYADLIPPPLDATALGVSPLSPAPVAPQPSPGESPVDKILRLVTAGLALKLGPGSGTGLLQGMNQAYAQKAQQRRLDDQTAQQQYRFEQQQYAQEEARHARDLEQRQRTVQSTLESLRKIAPTLKTKAEYDRYVDAYGQGLKNLGFRVDANYLRSAVPYSEPQVETRAQEMLDRWMKNPLNATLLKESPDEALKATVQFDRDGDGVPETVTLPDLVSLAQMPFAQDGSGQVIVSPAGTSKDDKATADAIYADLLEQARGEGKLVDGRTPVAAKNRNDLRVKANEMASDSKRKPETGGDGGLNANQQSMRVQALQARFATEPTIRDFNTIGSQAKAVDRILKGQWSGPSDMAAVYMFMKVLDPSSVVRETEYANAAKSGNIFQGWAARFNGALNEQGGFLSPVMRKEFARVVRERFLSKKSEYDSLANEYGRLIEQITEKPGGKTLLPDYGAAFADVGVDESATSAQVELARRRQQQGGK